MHAPQDAAAAWRAVWQVFRLSAPVAIGALCIWTVIRSLDPGSIIRLDEAVGALKAWQWIGAIMATGVSFWALARYDLVLHRHFQTGAPARAASVTGAAAIAIGQTVGMGVISGAFVRWRMLPDLSLADATKISLAVAVTFLIGLLFAFGVVAWLGSSVVVPKVFASTSLMLFSFCVLLAFLHPNLHAFGRRLSLPSLPALLTIGGLTLVDTVFAGMGIWMLLPSGVDLSFTTLLPAYLIALGAAIVSGAPGGVGPFELALMVLLPQVPDHELLVAILGYRVVYYALPTCLACLLLFRPFTHQSARDHRLTDVQSQDLAPSDHAEMGLLHQSDAQVLHARGAAIGVIHPGQSLTALFQPLHGDMRECLTVLNHVAHQQNRVALLYKANAKCALEARSLGWVVIRVADDMVVSLKEFSLDGPARRQLRRKLRQAEKAGVVVSPSPAPPWQDMKRVDADWQDANGRARCLTMGDFCPRYMRHQRIFLAYQDRRLIGFASFHRSDSESCLDIMRTATNAPSGTMHALVMAAISAAQDEGQDRLSLAAVPPEDGFVGVLARKYGANAGLSQFKTCFTPRRVPLYAAAPSSTALALGLADLWLAMQRPNSNKAQVHDENYEFDYSQTT